MTGKVYDSRFTALNVWLADLYAPQKVDLGRGGSCCVTQYSKKA